MLARLGRALALLLPPLRRRSHRVVVLVVGGGYAYPDVQGLGSRRHYASVGDSSVDSMLIGWAARRYVACRALQRVRPEIGLVGI